MWCTNQLTRKKLQPPAYVEHGRRLAEEKQEHGTNGEQGQRDRRAYEHRRHFEHKSIYRHELVQFAFTLLHSLVRLADLPQPELPRVLRLQVADPFRSHERHNADNRVANREYRPKHTNRFRITDVVRSVQM